MSNTRYNEEMRLQTVNRKQNHLPTYEDERRIRKVSIEELAAKNKGLERKLKQKEKEQADEKETVEILKKSLHIFMRPQG